MEENNEEKMKIQNDIIDLVVRSIKYFGYINRYTRNKEKVTQVDVIRSFVSSNGYTQITNYEDSMFTVLGYRPKRLCEYVVAIVYDRRYGNGNIQIITALSNN